MHAVTVAVLDLPARTVLSRYVVRVRTVSEAAAAAASGGRKTQADALVRLDAQLQAHLLALFAAGAPAARAGERAFEIVVRATEAGVTPGGEWMAAAPSEGALAPGGAVRPLKDFDPDAELVSVQTWIEVPKHGAPASEEAGALSKGASP